MRYVDELIERLLVIDTRNNSFELMIDILCIIIVFYSTIFLSNKNVFLLPFLRMTASTRLFAASLPQSSNDALWSSPKSIPTPL